MEVLRFIVQVLVLLLVLILLDYLTRPSQGFPVVFCSVACLVLSLVLFLLRWLQGVSSV